MIPEFQYHPDPIGTGSITEADEQCQCCGERRGYIYTASFYSRGSEKRFCPWCISDGAAAEKFDGMFSDDYPLTDAGIDPKIIVEVAYRTPGFSSWQQEVWLICCSDACEFHGDASKTDVANMNLDEFRSAFHDPGLTEEFFSDFKPNYTPGGNPAIHKWICRRCAKIQFYADLT